MYRANFYLYICNCFFIVTYSPVSYSMKLKHNYNVNKNSAKDFPNRHFFANLLFIFKNCKSILPNIKIMRLNKKGFCRKKKQEVI